MVSKELQEKLDLYEQIFFSLDKPIPFKGGLLLYPVLVEDYYSFYSCFPCLTMDKNTKTIIDEKGRPKKISNPKGIAQSYLAYLIDLMQSPEGEVVTKQFMGLLELVFHIKNGMYCPECKKEKDFSEIFLEYSNFIKNTKKEFEDIINANAQIEDNEIRQEIMNEIENKARLRFFTEENKCDCGCVFRDIFSIKNDGPIKKIMIKDVEITPRDFEELKALIPRQNILDYDGDKYIDPELKEELEIKARLQNKDYTSPTLEKQLVCVSVGTGFTFEYLYKISMRKLSLLLKTVDAKNMYYAQIQAAMSGMVKFKEDPKHWIFTDSRKNIKDELTSLENFEKKFERVT